VKCVSGDNFWGPLEHHEVKWSDDFFETKAIFKNHEILRDFVKYSHDVVFLNTTKTRKERYLRETSGERKVKPTRYHVVLGQEASETSWIQGGKLKQLLYNVYPSLQQRVVVVCKETTISGIRSLTLGTGRATSSLSCLLLLCAASFSFGLAGPHLYVLPSLWKQPPGWISPE
jgi:hypothetical protein